MWAVWLYSMAMLGKHKLLENKLQYPLSMKANHTQGREYNANEARCNPPPHCMNGMIMITLPSLVLVFEGEMIASAMQLIGWL